MCYVVAYGIPKKYEDVITLVLLLLFVPTRLYDTIAYENIQFLFIDKGKIFKVQIYIRNLFSGYNNAFSDRFLHQFKLKYW